MKFELTEAQATEARNWIDKHDEECRFADPMKQGAIGGRLTWKFTPTSIGIMATVCCACGESAFLMDHF